MPAALDDEVASLVLAAKTKEEANDWWKTILQAFGDEGAAWLGRNDRYFLLNVLLHRHDTWHDWLYARCREVEADPDGYLDLWAREHYKSSIITFTGAIQEILRDPEITIGIFAFNKPTARKFLRQIKYEFESNEDLKAIYPEVLWANPKKDSPRWSEDAGIVVKRQGNPKEATVEGHGLVDGQPTSAHFLLRIYDDVVTIDSVTSPEMMKKTTEAWSLSDNLGARGPNGMSRAWHIGTRYHFGDSYNDMMEMQAVKPRVYPATDDGTRDGKPVFLNEAAWEDKKRKQVSSVLAAQMLLNPAAGSQAMFRREWLKFMDIRPATLNIYIMADPASSKKKSADSTAMAVVGIDAAGNRWLVDGARHKMSLSERWDTLRALRKKWSRMPGVQAIHVGYEKYGIQSDIEYFQERMERDRDVWEIKELSWPTESGGSKLDRIQRLEPDFRNGMFYLPKAIADNAETDAQKAMRDRGEPHRIYRPVRRTDENRQLYSVLEALLNEYLVYPYSVHDDFLDATSRLYDMDPVPPIIVDQAVLEPEYFHDA